MPPYCTSADVNQYINNIPVKSGTSISAFIQDAADEMHMYAGGLYEIPFAFADGTAAAQITATTRILQTLNAKLAAGWMILAATITQEKEAVHAYAQSLVDGVVDHLERIRDEDLVLTGLKADYDRSNDLIRPIKVLISSPDGKDEASDEASFYNRPYTEIANPLFEVTGGPDV